jgi:phage shock protein C
MCIRMFSAHNFPVSIIPTSAGDFHPLIRKPVLRPSRFFSYPEGKISSFPASGPSPSANSLSLHYHFVYMNRLYRSRKDRIVAGVCGGLAGHIDADPSIIRLVWILVTLISLGTGLIVYLAAWIIIPEPPEESTQQTTITGG